MQSVVILESPICVKPPRLCCIILEMNCFFALNGKTSIFVCFVIFSHKNLA
ncbi:hypothetical protein WN943_001292 [Citrus x changshan-huyou]